MHSAKKVAGTPLYKHAHAGLEIARDSLLKRIDAFSVCEGADHGELQFRVTCESGTYVRVLAEDLAKRAGTLAHLKTLRRVQSSDMVIKDSLPLDVMLKTIEQKILPFNFKPLSEISSHISSFEIDYGQVRKILNGGRSLNRKYLHTLRRAARLFTLPDRTVSRPNRGPF